MAFRQIDYERAAALWMEGHAGKVIDATLGAKNCVTRARRALGVERVPLRLPAPAIDVERVAELWAQNTPAKVIDAMLGARNCVTRARRALGGERLPHRHIAGGGIDFLKVAQLWADNWSLKAINEHFGQTQCVVRARKALGVERVPYKTAVPRSPSGKLVRKAYDLAQVALLWGEGKNYDEIGAHFGLQSGALLVARARIALGVEAVPYRWKKAAPRAIPERLVGQEMGRHIVRGIGDGEYVVRDEEGNEELWRKHPDGVAFGAQLKLAFVSRLGLTEQRQAATA